jgi:hypothetical protein
MRLMTGSPALSSRRSLAAAGARLPRRPGPLAVFAFAVLLGAVAACGSTAPTAAPGPVFRSGRPVSLRQLDSAITGLYRDHPGIGGYTVQDVRYSTQARAKGLTQCTADSAGTAGQAETDSQLQAAESGQLMACAPFIFFLYRYGRDASVPAAATAAGDLYGYAVTHISGPIDARASLDELLRGWGLPVPALSPAEARSALKSSVFSAAGNSMLGQQSVHIAITGRKPGSAEIAERIAADIGTASGSESIVAGSARAQIRVTPKAAYFTGNAPGLTRLLGLPAAAAAKAGGRWVVIAAGTREYRDLAAEDTMASLPASILPPSENSAGLRTTRLAGKQVYILSWSTAASGTDPAVTAQLYLDATSEALPITETTIASGFSQTVTLSQWGEKVAVPDPPAAIPYARVTG